MCLWSFRDAALLQLPLKSLTVLDAASSLGLLGMLARHAASKTPTGTTTSPHTTHPHQQSPHCLWELVIVGLRSETGENSRGPAVRRHPEVSEREEGESQGMWGRGWKERQEIPPIPRWCFPDSSSDSSAAARVKYASRGEMEEGSQRKRSAFLRGRVTYAGAE